MKCSLFTIYLFFCINKLQLHQQKKLLKNQTKTKKKNNSPRCWKIRIELEFKKMSYFKVKSGSSKTQ
jgi:hypothetical protein